MGYPKIKQTARASIVGRYDLDERAEHISLNIRQATEILKLKTKIKTQAKELHALTLERDRLRAALNEIKGWSCNNLIEELTTAKYTFANICDTATEALTSPTPTTLTVIERERLEKIEAVVNAVGLAIKSVNLPLEETEKAIDILKDRYFALQALDKVGE